jgi:hypothetical protein
MLYLRYLKRWESLGELAGSLEPPGISCGELSEVNWSGRETCGVWGLGVNLSLLRGRVVPSMHIEIDAEAETVWWPYGTRVLVPQQTPPASVAGFLCKEPGKVTRRLIGRMSASSCVHSSYNRKTRSRSPCFGPCIADCSGQRGWAPAFLGPPFLPSVYTGVSGRRTS